MMIVVAQPAGDAKRAARSVTDNRQEPLMCRWNAYFGQPVLIDELLFRSERSPSAASAPRRAAATVA